MPEERATLRALVVDDEPLARERMRIGLGRIPEIEVAGECADGLEAVQAILDVRPDLVLLDIQMPGLDGFGVVERVRLERMPAVVFVTAYDRYALQAFEVHALDYVLKPFDPARFDAAVRHAVELVRTRRLGEAGQRLAALMRELSPGLEPSPGTPAKRILVRQGEGFGFVETVRIDWLEAAGNYVRVHAGERSWLVRATLASLMDSLDPRRFVRIHRSTIVNLDRVREIQPWVGGDYLAILTDGRQLRVSRTHREALLRPFA
jgi:two-component system LytT family response regulator